MVEINPQGLFENLIKENLAEKAETYSALIDRFGPEVIEIIEDVKGRRVRQEWEGISKSLGDNSLESIVKTVWNTRLEVFECAIDEKTNHKIQMKVTKCIFSEIANELGVREWGYRLFCKDDFHMVKGFNPKMKFKRTKTLMMGDDYCNHCYILD